MEQLLIHCANAIENNDTTLSQHILWVLTNITPPDGDSIQRLAWAFLRALIIRATKSGTCKQLTTKITTQEYSNLALHTHRFSILELANYVDLTPWHRFGYTAANAAILNVIQGYQIIHIVDISSTHCMQIPTLIDSIATRLQHPPKLIKLTVAALTDETPPMLESISSYHSIATKLTLFAKKCHNIVLEFTVIPTPLRHIVEHLACIESNPHEALIVNCQMTLHMITHHTMESPRRKLMDSIRAIDPGIVTVVDEDVDFSSLDLVSRVRSAWEFFWVRFDAAETFMGERKWERERYEAEAIWRIENLVAEDGVERQERRAKWGERMRAAGFRGVAAGEEATAKVKAMVEEYGGGWGTKTEEGDVVLTWKGHNVVFASAWAPN
ncbi:Scarecrow-like protein [Drosera capensis]